MQEESNLTKRNKRGEEEPPQQTQSMSKSVSMPEPSTKRLRKDNEDDL
jgi:hypothetical protein